MKRKIINIILIIAIVAVLLVVLLMVIGARAIRSDGTPETANPEECLHSEWADSVCTECGTVCSHESWTNGICDVCGFECSHDMHTQDGFCCVCGLPIAHSYHQLKCSCGAQLNLSTTRLPEELTQEVPEHGTVEYLEYETTDYITQYTCGETISGTKKCTVYLPYGYSPEQQHNVLFLYHGAGGSERSWLDEAHPYEGEELLVPTMLDAMIYYGYCEPLIIVGCTSSTLAGVNDAAGITVWVQLYPEVRNDLVQAIVENYGTYAEDSSLESIVAARDHFAMGGLSDGALVTEYAGMMNAMDIFSWFGLYSANAGMDIVTPKMANEWADYNVNYFYTTAGERDFQRNNVQTQYQFLLDNTDKVVDGENASLTIIEGCQHEWTSWIVSLYNTLLLFF